LRRDGFNLDPADLPALARRGNLIPLCREVPADLLTPVAAFLRLQPGSRHPFLLESVEGGEAIARYSFLGRDPVAVVRAGAGAAEGGDPVAALRAALRPWHAVRLPGMPRFTGGAVGYLSYDVVRTIERLPRSVPDDLGTPDLLFGIYDTVLAFDHLRQRIQIVTDRAAALARGYRRARRRIESIERLLRRPVPGPARGRRRGGRWSANITPARYQAGVRRAQDYIRAGDIFQVVLSQRYERRCGATPFAIYRALRRINPSPYMYFLDFGEVSLAGASPEMLVRVEGDRIRTRPIAGTRPRGAGEEEDLRLEEDLRADPKERAEHVMLVDLGRNDLGRVSRPGSIEVGRFMSVERYSHVMHLVSEVTGRLRPGADAFDGLIACFPAGTVSGAPKVRAMEIIEELETSRRGPYAGAVGYMDFSGNLDSCITIRTTVVRGGVAHVQAGAGIVADSVPRQEHRECVNKAGALIEAIDRAEAAA
jgi:anthranilate synthase component 1